MEPKTVRIRRLSDHTIVVSAGERDYFIYSPYEGIVKVREDIVIDGIIDRDALMLPDDVVEFAI